jgi:lipoprotein NlpI
MPTRHFPNRRSRGPLILAGVAALILVAWIGCHNSSRDAGALTSAGATHMQQREFDRAIRDFDRALSLRPGLVVAWRQRGMAYRAKGDFERAIADFDQAILLSSTDSRLYNERGLTYEALGDYAQAIGDFDRAISFKPTYATAFENRGRAYFYLGNFAQAASDLQRGLSPTDPDPYVAFWLHLARQRIKQNDSDDFRAHLTPSDSTWPSPIGRYLLGELSADSLRRLAAATESEAQPRGCQVAFFVGEDALLRGRTDSAAAVLGDARTSCGRERAEFRAAVAELKRLSTSVRAE